MTPVENIPQDKSVILFDGICNLCDRAVQFVIRHDKEDRFRFVSLQSETGRGILKHIGADPKSIDSIVLYDPGQAYYLKSDAALQISKRLGWPALARIFGWVPRILRDKVYDFVAARRYKWFGKRESCLVPDGDLRTKFIE